MDARLFDVLHDAADDHVLAVAERIHIDFGRRLPGSGRSRTGRSCEYSTASFMYCVQRLVVVAITMARPPSTYEGRTSTG